MTTTTAPPALGLIPGARPGQFDVAAALTALRRVVAHYGPTYIDRGACYYVNPHIDRDQSYPSCLVGHVVTDLTGELVPVDRENQAVTDTRHGVPLFPEFTYDARIVLFTAQEHQDDGKTWGEALAAAEAVAARLGWPTNAPTGGQ